MNILKEKNLRWGPCWRRVLIPNAEELVRYPNDYHGMISAELVKSVYWINDYRKLPEREWRKAKFEHSMASEDYYLIASVVIVQNLVENSEASHTVQYMLKKIINESPGNSLSYIKLYGAHFPDRAVFFAAQHMHVVPGCERRTAIRINSEKMSDKIYERKLFMYEATNAFREEIYKRTQETTKVLVSAGERVCGDFKWWSST